MRGTGSNEKGQKRGRALIVLDCTRDRVEPGGAVPVHKAHAMSRFAEGELAYFRERGRPVFHLFTLFPAQQVVVEGQLRFNVRGTPGAEPADAFAPRPGEIVQEKPGDSAFFGTPLDEQLREFGVEQVSLIGVETHGAVLATALDATARGYQVVVPDTCVASQRPELHEAALKLIREARWLAPHGPTAGQLHADRSDAPARGSHG